jgi:hypothetical protein
MHDTIHIVPNHISAAVDTIRILSSKPSELADFLLKWFGIIVPAIVSIFATLFVAQGAKTAIKTSSLNTQKQLDNALSIAKLSIDNSTRLFERQTYIDLILRNKDLWRTELMEISAQIEKATISFLNSDQDTAKQKHKAQSSYLIKKMQTRLSTNPKYEAHKKLRVALIQLDDFVKGIREHDFESNEDVYKHLEDIHEKTYLACKEVWDEIQAKCQWKDL